MSVSNLLEFRCQEIVNVIGLSRPGKKVWWLFEFFWKLDLLTLLAPGVGGTMNHRGIFLSRTLEQQMILNWNFVTFNIFLWWIKCWKSQKKLPIVRNDSFVKNLWRHFYVFILRSKFYWKLCENFFIGKF